MGNCWGSPARTPSSQTTPTTTTKPTAADASLSSSAGISHASSKAASSNVSIATSSGTSNATSSRDSLFLGVGNDEAYPNGQILPTPDLRRFSFVELKAATKNFRSDTVLGQGGFGKVYKGWLDNKAPGRAGVKM
uniref:Uncharacterized protein n=1 Tax=Rhizophora mucronata TaxID=61149 RepID=A0A2P2Q7K0_RHIMU